MGLGHGFGGGEHNLKTVGPFKVSNSMEFFVSDQVDSPPQPLTPSAPSPSSAPTTMPKPESDFEGRLNELVNRGNISAETKANLDRRIQNAMANGNLSSDVVAKALNVIVEINDKALVAEFLKSGRGGISLLAKLDGLPTELRSQIVNEVAKRNLHIANLNQILDEYHEGRITDQKLEKIIKCLSKLGANGVQQALRQGGIDGLLQKAGAVASGSLGGRPPVMGDVVGVVTHNVTGAVPALTAALQTIDPQTKIVDFIKGSSRDLQEVHKKIILAILEFGEARRLENEKQKEELEESCKSNRPFTLGSAETIQDLQDALKTIINSYGGDINAAAGVIQTCLKFDIPGNNISVLEVIRALLVQAQRAKNPPPPTSKPTSQPHPQKAPPPQPPTAQPPASSLATSGPPGTSSHRA